MNYELTFIIKIVPAVLFFIVSGIFTAFLFRKMQRGMMRAIYIFTVYTFFAICSFILSTIIFGGVFIPETAVAAFIIGYIPGLLISLMDIFKKTNYDK